MFSKFSVRFLNVSPRRFNLSVGVAAHPIRREEELVSKYRFDFAMPDDTKQILNFLQKNYFCHNALSKSLKLCSKQLDPTMELHIKESLAQGMSIVARKASREEEEIVGIAINQKSCKWDGDRLDELARAAESINTRKLLHIWALLAREPALHDYVSQLSIFDLKLVSLKKELHNDDLATELTQHSLSLGRDLNYKFARIDSTDEHAKKIAESFKMEKLWDVPYKNIVSDDGKTPVANPDQPNSHAAVYYTSLESLPLDLDSLGSRFLINLEKFEQGVWLRICVFASKC